MVVDDPEHPYTDSTISIFARDYRNRHKDMRLNRGSVYFDLLGNRLPKKQKNSVYIKR